MTYAFTHMGNFLLVLLLPLPPSTAESLRIVGFGPKVLGFLGALKERKLFFSSPPEKRCSEFDHSLFETYLGMNFQHKKIKVIRSKSRAWALSKKVRQTERQI